MMDPRHWQSWYIKNGTTIGPVNGEQYFVEDFVNKRLELITFPDSWVTRWCDEGVEWQTNITKKYNKQTGNDYVYLGGEFHPDIKMVHFTRSENKPHNWKDYRYFI